MSIKFYSEYLLLVVAGFLQSCSNTKDIPVSNHSENYQLQENMSSLEEIQMFKFKAKNIKNIEDSPKENESDILLYLIRYDKSGCSILYNFFNENKDACSPHPNFINKEKLFNELPKKSMKNVINTWFYTENFDKEGDSNTTYEKIFIKKVPARIMMNLMTELEKNSQKANMDFKYSQDLKFLTFPTIKFDLDSIELNRNGSADMEQLRDAQFSLKYELLQSSTYDFQSNIEGEKQKATEYFDSKTYSLEEIQKNFTGELFYYESGVSVKKMEESIGNSTTYICEVYYFAKIN